MTTHTSRTRGALPQHLLFKTALLQKRIIRGDHPGKQASKQAPSRTRGLYPNDSVACLAFMVIYLPHQTEQTKKS